jgi:hypothetical protein
MKKNGISEKTADIGFMVASGSVRVKLQHFLHVESAKA